MRADVATCGQEMARPREAGNQRSCIAVMRQPRFERSGSEAVCVKPPEVNDSRTAVRRAAALNLVVRALRRDQIRCLRLVRRIGEEGLAKIDHLALVG